MQPLTGRMGRMTRRGHRALALVVCSVFVCGTWLASASHLFAQGVTSGVIAGIVLDAQQQPVTGASVLAIHEPSGTSYEATTRADGRFSMPGMRIGGPYSVTVTATSASGAPFDPLTQAGISVNLGVATDLEFAITAVAVNEQVTVTATSDPIFSSNRTGAATTVSRAQISTLPTISQRIQDITRLTPQSNGGLSFNGQDGRLNNVTVDGSYFNNSFGLGNSPGDRTGVAPISLDAIEEFQVNIAPYDVRQGNFVGAGVNTVTRSGGNTFHGSLYHRFRDESLVGTEAGNLTLDPGTFNYRQTGGWVTGPVLRNKLFFFGNFEDEANNLPGTTFRSNAGGQAVGGTTTRVLSSDLQQLSAFLQSSFGYETGPFEGYEHQTPATRLITKADYNLSGNHKLVFRYTHLDSRTDNLVSNSGGLGFGNRRTSTQALNFRNSNYQLLENIRSGVGEWNAVIGSSMANTLIAGYSYHDESRNSLGTFFPFVDILDNNTTYTSFGFEPFTPNNELRYSNFQLQNNFTRFGNKHALTFGGTFQRYESENVFFPGSQSVYTYNSLTDFYTDANSFLTNPNRTSSPVTLRRFQVRWNNIPGNEKPLQPLEVTYAGGYVQDEWRPARNLTLTLGIRFDVPFFGDTAYANSEADGLAFRDENGQNVSYATGDLPEPTLLWSPRVGFNWDVGGNRQTQIRGGTGIFTGPPAYIWISNQIGNTGVLTGFEQVENTTARPFDPDTERYKPANVTGEPASSYDLALTDADFKFPQIWRSNLAVDRRLPGGWSGTAELVYGRDVNAIAYINANLPEASTSFAGPDARPRWTSGNRIYSHIASAVALQNQSDGYSWNLAASVERPFRNGFWLKSAYSYGETLNTVDGGFEALGAWSGNPNTGDPNNPGLGLTSAAHRFFLAASYRFEYFKFGGTMISVFSESRTGGQSNYTFGGDLNGDGFNNDLIYVARDVSEMNFQPYTVGSGASARTFGAQEQAAAWDAYIEQDDYLRGRRGQYAERGAVLLPLVHRTDLTVAQDVFVTLGGRRHSFQVRADVLNFGNLLNSDWGVGQRLVSSQPLMVPTAAQGGPADAQGRPQYRLRSFNNELMTSSREQSIGTSDVYRVQFSLRYSF